MSEYITTDWHGLYSEGWTGEIVPDAMAHPAKYSRALIRHIYDHLLLKGLLAPGDTCVDPFGGVALGALDAMRCGLRWVGCELEEKFVRLGRQNIDLWTARYAPHFPVWGSAALLQGDGRRLAQVLRPNNGGCISSPPYVNGVHDRNRIDADRLTGNPTGRHSQAHAGGYGAEPGQLGVMPEGDFAAAISSPPYAGNDKRDYTKEERDHKLQGQGSCFRGTYSRSEGQLGDMPTGDFAAAVSSPPYNLPISQDHNGSRNGRRGVTPSEMGAFVRYGNTPGQLEGLPQGDLDAAISSPPHEHRSYEGMSNSFAEWRALNGRSNDQPGVQGVVEGYGRTPGQLAGSGDDFWSAACTIVEQVHQVLRPGACAVWVVKDYVRNGQRVPFSDQWRRLCESRGFATIHVHRAWLVEHHAAQLTLDGDLHARTIERKSFFRRLAERRGSPRIDWETVLCMQKIEARS